LHTTKLTGGNREIRARNNESYLSWNATHTAELCDKQSVYLARADAICCATTAPAKTESWRLRQCTGWIPAATPQQRQVMWSLTCRSGQSWRFT